MSFAQMNANEFVSALASKDAVPGGGGASALAGAVGTALGNMVGSLTVGKKKYADVEEEIVELKKKSDDLQSRFLELIDADAAAFEPLARAYGIPKDDPGREKIMEEALRTATATPMDIMRTCAEAIEIIEQFAAKGSVLAVSDAGVGAVLCKAALQGAALNVFINTKSMTDRTYAENIEKEADTLLEKYCAGADEIYASVTGRLRN